MDEPFRGAELSTNRYFSVIGARCSVDRTPLTTTDVSRRTIIRGMAGLAAFGGVGTAAADDEDGGADPSADVSFLDQTVSNDGSGPTVTVDLEMNEGGYQSIHQYSRFQFAEGEDPEEYDVPVPDELGNPICESLIGITEYLEPGVHEDLEVPLFRSDSPAVELGAAGVGPLEESQAMIAIPHYNTTGEGTFNCPDDPSTPDPFENGEEVDGAFRNGSQDVGSIGVSHDLAAVLVEDDDEEQKEVAEREVDLIRTGVLVPQPVGPGDEEEEEIEEEGDEDAEDENGEKQEQEEEEEDTEDEEDEEDDEDEESEDEQEEAESDDEDGESEGEQENEDAEDDEGEEEEENEQEDEDDEDGETEDESVESNEESDDDGKGDDRREKHGRGRGKGHERGRRRGKGRKKHGKGRKHGKHD